MLFKEIIKKGDHIFCTFDLSILFVKKMIKLSKGFSGQDFDFTFAETKI
jgi:hypothetical protein